MVLELNLQIVNICDIWVRNLAEHVGCEVLELEEGGGEEGDEGGDVDFGSGKLEMTTEEFEEDWLEFGVLDGEGFEETWDDLRELG